MGTQQADEWPSINRTITDNATACLFMMDAAGRCTFMNPAAERVTGYTFAEVEGRVLHEVIHHTHPDGTPFPVSECPIDRALPQNNQMRAHEDVFVRKDGTFFPVLCAASPIIENGLPVGTVVEVRDITEEKAAAAYLREEREALETLNRIGPVLSAELDLQKLVQVVTDAATGLSGAQFGAFFYNVTDERGESLTLYTLCGVPRDTFARFPTPRNTAVFGPTFRGEGVVRLDNVQQDPRYGRNHPYAGMPEGHLPVTSYLAIPVVSRSGTVLGGLFFGHEKPGVFTERAERIVVGLAAQAAVAMDNAHLFAAAQREIEERRRAEEALRESELRTRAFLRDVLASVTEGKLRLCDSVDDLPSRVPSEYEPLVLSSASLRTLRQQTRELATEQGFDNERSHDLVTAIGEAGMNAVRHAGGGIAQLGKGADGSIQVWIEDNGAGINLERIPRATLERGFSYAGTLGHGFWLMLNTIDRLYLLTGPEGTTVVIEQDPISAGTVWLAEKA